MGAINIPVNLQEMFQTINDRLNRLELGYNGPQASADSAYSLASSASSSASSAYAVAAGAIQRDSYNVFNAYNQLTTINGNGITVYAGSSPTSGARVVLNSAGFVGVNSSGTTTFAINASTGNVSLLGTVTATAGSIGNFNITSNDYLTYGTTAIYGGSSANATYAFVDTTKGAYVYKVTTNGGGITATGSGEISSFYQVTVTGMAIGTSVAVNIDGSGHLIKVSSSERYKTNITPLPNIDYLSKLLQLQPVTFTYKPEYAQDPHQIVSGLIAERVAEIPEFNSIVAYNEDGEIESVAYDRLSVFILPALKQIHDRLNKLEGE
jgi:Chaperone of endosialidase